MSSLKIGIVCSGGGMTCAYSAGALEAIHTHYGLRTPHVIVGASGSAGSCAYFLSGQWHVGREIWCNQLSNRQMISWRRWPILDINYLVCTVFKERFPLRMDLIQTSRTALLVPLSDTTSGSPTYQDLRDTAVNPWSVLIAAKSIPLLTKAKIAINESTDRTYTDGDLGQRLNQHVRAARNYGAEEIIVIDNQSNYTWVLKLAHTIMGLVGGPGIRAVFAGSKLDDHNKVASNPHQIVLRPSQPLQMGALTDQKAKLERAYDMGYQDAVHSPHLQKLLAN